MGGASGHADEGPVVFRLRIGTSARAAGRPAELGAHRRFRGRPRLTLLPTTSRLGVYVRSMATDPELIFDTPEPGQAEIPEIEILEIALGVPTWSENEGWVDSGDVYYEAEFWTVDLSRDYIRALADELGINAAQGNGFIVDMRDGRHDIGASGLEVVNVLVLAVQVVASKALERAFHHVATKVSRYTREPMRELSEEAAIEKARMRIATRYDTEAMRLQLIRTVDGPEATEVELAEPTGYPRYTVEFSKNAPTTKITRVLAP